MKISSIKLRRIRLVETVGDIEPAWNPGSRMHITRGGNTFVEIRTDEGVTGIGPGADPALVERLEAQMVGQDPFDIERHAERYPRGLPYRGAAGIDMALWDIVGKVAGQPLYKIWGGGRTKVPAYASMIQLSTPEERADMATGLADQGWKAIKIRLHHQTMAEDIRTVEAVKAAVGDRMDIMVDANQAQSAGTWQPGILWDYRRALDTAIELDRLGCYWLEEPLSRFAFDDLARINDRVAMPIAGGENNRGFHEFVQMIKQNVYDILQPESMVNEGITTLRKIGVLAEAFGKKVAPHHGGGDIGVIAHLHLIASWPHAPYLELLHDPPIGDYHHRFSIFENPPEVDTKGMVPVPSGPGLGVSIDPDLIEA